MSKKALHDRPVASYIALLNTGAGILIAVGMGAASVAGTLPQPLDRYAPQVAMAGMLMSSIAGGLFAIGKGLYSIGKPTSDTTGNDNILEASGTDAPADVS